jgi:predicted AlkP superfamily phosphohydrolase/phosphomutase
MAKRPVLAIGLDAAEPSLVERWMAQGYLPALARLRALGVYGRLRNFQTFVSETAWTTFLTGCRPEQTGFWTHHRFREDSYGIDPVEVYDFEKYPPFYALGDQYRVAVFDLPKTTLSDRVNGLQVLAWGEHGPMTPSQSRPAGLLAEVTRRHGPHPVLRRDFATLWSRRSLAALERALHVGIERRAAICLDLLRREPWDLFLTAFGETHVAGHYFWHTDHADHPLHRPGALPAMRGVYQAVDRAVGALVAARPDASVVVFSPHGMEAGSMDLPSTVILPELLYRWSLPGRYGLARGDPRKPPPPALVGPAWRSWVPELWRTKHDTNPVRRFLRRQIPLRLVARVSRFIGRASVPVCPLLLGPLGHQPPVWYQPAWSRMRAFALPSYSDGFVRINVRGREAHGLVAASDYEAVCEDLTRALHDLVDARSGAPIVKEVIRTRRNALEQRSSLPDPDLVVRWQPGAVDVVDSPSLGRIGPAPFPRAGTHRGAGFLLATGPGIAPGTEIAAAHVLDLAPTILSLMAAPPAAYMEGRPVLP